MATNLNLAPNDAIGTNQMILEVKESRSDRGNKMRFPCVAHIVNLANGDVIYFFHITYNRRYSQDISISERTTGSFSAIYFLSAIAVVMNKRKMQ